MSADKFTRVEAHQPIYWTTLVEGKLTHIIGPRPRLGWPQYGKSAYCGAEIPATEANYWAKISMHTTKQITCEQCRAAMCLGVLTR